MTMPVKITGPTIDSFLKPVDALFDAKRFEHEVAPKMVAEIKKNVVARFDANKVGGTFFMKYAVGDTQTEAVTDVIISIVEELKKTKPGTEEYKALLKRYDQITKDEDRAMSSKKDISVEAIGMTKDRRGGKGYLGETLGIEGDESGMRFRGQSMRLPNSAFTDVLKSLILEEPIMVAATQNSQDIAKYSIWIGRSAYFRSHSSKIQIPPPEQLRALSQMGYQPFYQDTLHIMQYGTATKSTDDAPYIKRSPYLWVLMPYIKKHPGKKGRHFYINEAGMAYEQDVDLALSVLDSAIRLME